VLGDATIEVNGKKKLNKFEEWNESFVPKSRKRHLISFEKFLRANNPDDSNESGKLVMTPEELLEEARRDRKTDASPVEYMYVKRINVYKNYLLGEISEDTGKPLSHGSVRTHLSDVMRFYEHYGFTVPRSARKILYEYTDQTVETHVKTDVGRDAITEMLEKADITEKALILAQVSSGLSNKDLLNIRVSQFKRGRHESGITVLKDLHRGKLENKSPIEYTTFFSKEATTAIDEYLEYRNRPPVHKTKNKLEAYEKRRVTSDNNYLFIKKKIGEPVKSARDSDAYRKMSTSSLLAIYRKLHPPTGKAYDWNDVRGHLLRKYFNNVFAPKGIHSDYSETMMGHSLGGSRDHYNIPGTKELIEAYLVVELDLTFTNKEMLKDAKEDLKAIEQLKVENEEIKAQNKEMLKHIQAQHDENMFLSIRQQDTEAEMTELYKALAASDLYNRGGKIKDLVEKKLGITK